MVFVSQVETHQAIRAFFRPGTRSPFHASGIGKAILSHLTPERIAAIADLTKMLKENALRHTIGEHFTLDRIAAAHEAVEEGKLIGNVVIDIA